MVVVMKERATEAQIDSVARSFITTTMTLLSCFEVLAAGE